MKDLVFTTKAQRHEGRQIFFSISSVFRVVKEESWPRNYTN